ncbi:hypothetical protein [Pseudoduganella lutea]|uniref:hypothetical protein n=1 Tax=Pseudoduganella lutea TaxID=321985 RepID=UPI001A91ACBA|nr:hypothetical protein [Pseudoduganella lutea]
MIPFLYMHLAPQFHFPFSGAVSQAIDPDIAWFSNLIHPGAGHARIERRAFEEVASYGKQLGLITEVLLEQASRVDSVDSDAVRKLRDLQSRIENIKVEEYGGEQVAVARLAQALERWSTGNAVLPALETQARQVEQ